MAERDLGDDVNELLERMRAGEDVAESDLFDALYAELRRVAERLFRSQRAHHTLQPTALVHEAYLKIARPEADRGTGGGRWNDRAHFVAVAARAMRQVLVNHARDKSALKRGGPEARQRVTISGVPDHDSAQLVDVLAVHESLNELQGVDARAARIAELRYFAGLTNPEIAEVLGVSLRTVELDWRMAKSWLAGRLRSEG